MQPIFELNEKTVEDVQGFIRRRVLFTNSILTDAQWEEIGCRAIEAVNDLISMDFELKEGQWLIELRHQHLVLLFAEALIHMFKKQNATNYVTMEVDHPEFGPFDITMKRKHGKTPAEVATAWKNRFLELVSITGRIISGDFANPEQSVKDQERYEEILALAEKEK